MNVSFGFRQIHVENLICPHFAPVTQLVNQARSEVFIPGLVNQLSYHAHLSPEEVPYNCETNVKKFDF